MILENKIPVQREPDCIINRNINGMVYKARLFFPKENAETLQQKYERILRNRVIAELQKHEPTSA